MRAACLEAPETIVMREMPQPIPKEGEALVRVGSCGVCGSDVHLYRDGRIGDAILTEPHVMGHEFGGVVEAVGSKELEPLVGRKVAVEPAIPCMTCDVCLAGNQNCCPTVMFCGLPPTPGGCRDYVTAAGRLCEPVPDSLTHNQIAMLEPLAVAMHVIELAKPSLGGSAVILGAGTIGQMILESAKHYCLDPLIVTDRFDNRLAMAKSAGATHVVNIDKTDPIEAVQEITGGVGVDYVFEATTGDDAPEQAVGMAAFAGKVFQCGLFESDEVRFTNSIARRKGLTLYSIRRSRRTLTRAIKVLAAGKVDVDRLITHEFPLEELGKAFDIASNYKDGVVKAMIRIGQ